VRHPGTAAHAERASQHADSVQVSHALGLARRPEQLVAPLSGMQAGGGGVFMIV
jgi:hypothetical protein